MDNNEEITRIISGRRAYRTSDIPFPLRQVGLLGVLETKLDNWCLV